MKNHPGVTDSEVTSRGGFVYALYNAPICIQKYTLFYLTSWYQANYRTYAGSKMLKHIAVAYVYALPRHNSTLKYTQGVTTSDKMGRWLSFQPVYTYAELP